MRVFIASTISDLKEYRQAAKLEIKSMGHQPVMVPNIEQANPDEIVSICQNTVCSCDACIVIVGEQRGSSPEGVISSDSYTSLEATAAIEAKIPVFAYFVEKEVFLESPVEPTFGDYKDRLRWIEKFRDQLFSECIHRWNIREPEKVRFLVRLDIEALSRGQIRPSMPRGPRFMP